MSMPTQYELERALHEAARLRESGQDHFFIGKALLNSHYRLEKLERVLELTEAYFKFGHDEQTHARLIQAIERYRQLSARTAVQHAGAGFGLE